MWKRGRFGQKEKDMKYINRFSWFLCLCCIYCLLQTSCKSNDTVVYVKTPYGSYKLNNESSWTIDSEEEIASLENKYHDLQKKLSKAAKHKTDYLQSAAKLNEVANQTISLLDSCKEAFRTLPANDLVLVQKMMITESRGLRLKTLLTQTRHTILNLPMLNTQDVEFLDSIVTISVLYNESSAKKLGKGSWEAYHFDHVPAIAALTLLNKFKLDVLYSRNQALERMLQRIQSKK